MILKKNDLKNVGDKIGQFTDEDWSLVTYQVCNQVQNQFFLQVWGNIHQQLEAQVDKSYDTQKKMI